MKTSADIELNKKNLRKKIISLRDSIPEDQRNKKSRLIALKLFKNRKYRESECILFFYPFGSEVDTRLIISHSLCRNKRIILPKVSENNNIETYFVKNPEKELKPGYFGIMEPDIQKCRKAALKEIDLAVIPGVCFDKHFNRLGYGGGFYDRLILQLDKNILKISLCFDIQLIENVPMSPYDMKVDMIITEKEILTNLNN
ncbi:MAG TPA: 5-formyltetrahydrofolate cyclo-ligase [Actinobacteria bacterium]|nr:5-formyltetrahydrofolate cyclo-ligase [Actinomycetota bacterium]